MIGPFQVGPLPHSHSPADELNEPKLETSPLTAIASPPDQASKIGQRPSIIIWAPEHLNAVDGLYD